MGIIILLMDINAFLVNDLEESADDKYKKGTKINEIKALYNFDARIRRIFFKYILLIETNIKNLIAYTFSQAHPQENLFGLYEF